MKPWKIVVIPTVIMLVIASIYTYSVWKKRQNPGVVGQEQKVTMDDVAVVRMEFPQHFDDVKDLEGKTVWMKNGYTMPYFPYTAGKVDFKKRVGVIPPLQKLNVKKAIKEAVPATVDDGISHGQRQALLVFTLPGASSGDDKQEFATPVGAMDGGEEQYYDDLLFFYDDPRTIYSHWPSDIWAAIDSHQVKPGMNELQTRLALGQKIQTDNPQTEGNRTVTYDADGKKWTVTFRGDKASTVNSGQ